MVEDEEFVDVREQGVRRGESYEWPLVAHLHEAKHTQAPCHPARPSGSTAASPWSEELYEPRGPRSGLRTRLTCPRRSSPLPYCPTTPLPRAATRLDSGQLPYAPAAASYNPPGSWAPSAPLYCLLVCTPRAEEHAGAHHTRPHPVSLLAPHSAGDGDHRLQVQLPGLGPGLPVDPPAGLSRCSPSSIWCLCSCSRSAPGSPTTPSTCSLASSSGTSSARSRPGAGVTRRAGGPSAQDQLPQIRDRARDRLLSVRHLLA